MSKTLLSVSCIVLVTLVATPALLALPPINKEWQERYLEKNPPPAFKGEAAMQECNVCHEGMNKKDKNEYGQAVGKHISKKDLDKLKGMPAAIKKAIQDALEKAEAEQNSQGEKFGDLMKNGKLPGSK